MEDEPSLLSPESQILHPVCRLLIKPTHLGSPLSRLDPHVPPKFVITDQHGKAAIGQLFNMSTLG